jgi:hypothetical protein
MAMYYICHILKNKNMPNSIKGQEQEGASKESLVEVMDMIETVLLKIMYARIFHPEKLHVYLERLKELEGELPKNTIDETFDVET